MDYLNRGQSHLPDAIWREIDNAAVEAARERLTGRRYLELQGPFGAGLTSIEAGNDDYCASHRPRKPARSQGAPFWRRCCGGRFISAYGGLPGIWKMVNRST
jgi:hypothetical protein